MKPSPDPDCTLPEKQQEKQKKKTDYDFSWTWRVFLLSFGISVVLSFASESAAEGMNPVLSCLVLLCFIVFGIVFDVIGIAIATADGSVFNAMASRNVKGARAALWFISKSAVMATFCNDVIGDVSGVLCGTMASVIALSVASSLHLNLLFTSILFTAFTSALIVGGKALFKRIAMKKSNDIVLGFSRFCCKFVSEEKFKKKNKR